jgi:Na+-transporting NADH:ubiquinone oxidoreductase subunit NqrC
VEPSRKNVLIIVLLTLLSLVLVIGCLYALKLAQEQSDSIRDNSQLQRNIGREVKK